MQRVLEVIPCLYRGGTEAYVMNNCRSMVSDELRFDFFVFGKEDYPYAREIEQMGGRIFYGVVPSIGNTLEFLKLFSAVLNENGPYTAVHSHGNQQNALPMLCAKFAGVKNRISHAHSVDPIPTNAVRRLIFYIRRYLIKCFSTDFLACSEAAGESIYGSQFFKQNGRILENGIEVDRFCFANPTKILALKKEFMIDGNPVVIGNISRFDQNKNQTFLLDVFAEFLKIRSDSVLLLGGNNAGELEHIKEKVKVLGIQNQVRFIGVRSDVAECLGLINIYILPSISEGLPIGILEAQAAGCLCYASTGVPRRADMGLDSMFFKDLSDSALDWAACIENQYKNFHRPDSIFIKKAFCKKHFDLNSSAEELRQLYVK